MEEGLKFGDNHNGTAADLALCGNPEKRKLFLVSGSLGGDNPYGDCLLEVSVDESKLHHSLLAPNTYWLEQEGKEEIAIPPEDIVNLQEEYEMGICSPSLFCGLYCPQFNECEQIKNKNK